MAKRYYRGPITDLTAKVGVKGFDRNGVYRLCNEFGKEIGKKGFRGWPVPSLKRGARTTVLLTSFSDEDMTDHYPNFVEEPHGQMKTYLDTPDNYAFDPEEAKR